MTILYELAANTTGKFEQCFLNVDKFKIAFQLQKYAFEIDVNSTELAQKLVNLLNLKDIFLKIICFCFKS